MVLRKSPCLGDLPWRREWRLAWREDAACSQAPIPQWGQEFSSQPCARVWCGAGASRELSEGCIHPSQLGLVGTQNENYQGVLTDIPFLPNSAEFSPASALKRGHASASVSLPLDSELPRSGSLGLRALEPGWLCSSKRSTCYWLCDHRQVP